MRSADACPLCASAEVARLPDPGPRSMTSDWQVTAVPLGKFSCLRCGVAYRDPRLPPAAEFGSGYELYAHPPGDADEQKRQRAYASWIAESVPAGKRVLDVGCGNGSLLLALGERWPAAELSGCDPSPESVHFARAAGLTAWTGTAAELTGNGSADLVITVNVIEHTTDPRAFVITLASALSDDGRLVIICPHGSRAGVELLIADHLYSFSADHLDGLLRAAGLTLSHWATAPSGPGGFQIAVASRTGDHDLLTPDDPRSLFTARQRYLSAWRDLDAGLLSRLPSDVVCFGAGEAAGLLRAYAPGTWRRVTRCATDDSVGGTFGDRPHVALDAIDGDTTILVGVRPHDQPAVAARLRMRFHRVVTWYDLLPSDGV